jgi:hypothetical protein
MSIFNRKRDQPSSVTAAARPIPPSDKKAVAWISGALRPWQFHAWNFYDALAEIHYPASYIGYALSRFRYHIAEIPADNLGADPVEVPAKDRSKLYRAAEEILAAFDGDLGDVNELARLYGVNKTIAADCWLTGVDRANQPTNWEILSIRELRAQGDGKFLRYPQAGTNPMPEGMFDPRYANRLWTKHPAATELADCAMQSLSGDCERLTVLNRSLTTRILSKLAQAGYVFIPSSMSISGAPTAPTGDGQLAKDPMMQSLMRQAEQSVLDGTGQFVPTGIRGPATEGKEIRFINMDRAIDRVEMELRSELRNNIANGMNLPREAQQGLGDATHWTTWAIGDSTVEHVTPEAIDFVRSTSRVYLWPLLRDWNAAHGNRFTEGDIRRIVIDADAAAIVSRPNGAEDARQLADRLAISPDALRARSGAQPEEAPTDEQYLRMLGVKNNNPYLATMGLAIHGDVDWDMVAKVGSAEGAPGVGGTPPSRRPVDNGTPGEGDKVKASVDPALWAAFASGHLAAARKTVGAKVRARCEPHPEAFAAVKPLANEQVLSGLDDWEAVGLTDEIVTGFFTAAFAPLAAELPGAPELVATFIDKLSWLATSQQHSPITHAQIAALAAAVLSTSTV